MKTKWQLVMGAGLAALFFWMGSDAMANLAQQKIIKGVYPGKEKYSCTICHVSKLPKKDSHVLNDYGKKAKEAAGADKMPTAEIYRQLGDPDAKK